MIGPLGKQRPAAIHGQRCLQMTRRHGIHATLFLWVPRATGGYLGK